MLSTAHVPLKLEVNQSVEIDNIDLPDCIKIWNVKYDRAIVIEDKIYYSRVVNDSGSLFDLVEKRIAEVYGIKGNKVYRHSDEVIYVQNDTLIGVGNCNEVEAIIQAEKQAQTELEQVTNAKEQESNTLEEKQAETVPLAKPKKTRMGATAKRNQSDLEAQKKKQKQWDLNRLFSDHFLTGHSHITLMAYNILIEVGFNKFNYEVIEDVSPMPLSEILSLSAFPHFIFYKANKSIRWNMIFLHTTKNGIIEVLYKDNIHDDLKNQINALLDRQGVKESRSKNDLIKYEKLSKIPGNGETTDSGLEAIRYMLHLGLSVYPEEFSCISNYYETCQKSATLLRWSLLVERTVERLSQDQAFKDAFYLCFNKMPEVNDQTRLYCELLKKFEEREDNDSGKTSLDGPTIAELEAAKEAMLESYATDIKYFKNEYRYKDETASTDEHNGNRVQFKAKAKQGKIGKLQIELDYSTQMCQINILLDIFKGFYLEDNLKRISELELVPLLDQELDIIAKELVKDELQERVKQFFKGKKATECPKERAKIQPKEISKIIFIAEPKVSSQAWPQEGKGIPIYSNELSVQTVPPKVPEIKSKSEILSELCLNKSANGLTQNEITKECNLSATKLSQGHRSCEYGASQIQDMPADGNSFFHAVRRQLSINNLDYQTMNHSQLRELVVNHVKTHSIELQSSFVAESCEAYTTRIAKDQERVDHITIQALSDALGIEIIIINDNQIDCSTIINPSVNQGIIPSQITLSHVSENQYISIEGINRMQLLATLADNPHNGFADCYLTDQVKEVESDDQYDSEFSQYEQINKDDEQCIVSEYDSADLFIDDLVKIKLRKEADEIEIIYGSRRLVDQVATQDGRVKQKDVKDWNKDEVNKWGKILKGKLQKTSQAIIMAIAVMDRANELVTGHRLRDTQKLAVLIFMGGSYSLSYGDKASMSHCSNFGTGSDDIIFFLEECSDGDREKKKLMYRLGAESYEVMSNQECGIPRELCTKIMHALESKTSCLFSDQDRVSLLSSTKSVDFVKISRSDDNKGHISQIMTGEGKTTIVSVISAMKVLQGETVDVITSNPILAANGAKDKENFYGLLGISVAHNNPETNYFQGPRLCYSADIVYGSMNNFQFDYLRDRFERFDTFGGRKPENSWVVLDEVDSLLIDQGGNIAKLSTPLPGMESLRYAYILIWKALDAAENEASSQIQLQLENKKMQLQKKVNEIIDNLKYKYPECQLSSIEKDKNLSQLLTDKMAESPQNLTVISQLEAEIFTKQLEILKSYQFVPVYNNPVAPVLKERELGISLQDRKLFISSFTCPEGLEIPVDDKAGISQDFYEFLAEELEYKTKAFSFSKNLEVSLLAAMSAYNIAPAARIDIAKDLKVLEELDLYSNPLEYEQEEDILAEGFLSSVKAKIKDQGSILADLMEKKIIPGHLHNYVQKNLDQWIESALSAKYQYHENQQYKIVKQKDEDVVIPVDNANTGVSMHNTILSNGLHQFLQLKHNLGLSFESLTSSYISNLSYISKYGSKILGLTGTLGSTAEQELLGEVYNLGFSVMPAYKHKNFQLFPGQVVNDNEFTRKIASLALGELLREGPTSIVKSKENEIENQKMTFIAKPRAVLIICDSIKDANEIEAAIKSQAQAANIKANIKIYTDETEAGITELTLVPNDIIIATNIAGRGTDFKTNAELEANGGLHVIVGFLPCNQRVQDQAFGRTARQGNAGSGQLVIKTSEVKTLGFDISEDDFDRVLEKRNVLESRRIADIRACKVKELKFNDQLFELFSEMYGSFKRDHKYDYDQKWTYTLKDIKEKWAFWLAEKDYTIEKIERQGETLQVGIEFAGFSADLIVVQIKAGNISHNPFYAVCLAEKYLELGGKDNREKAKKALNRAIEIGSTSELLYSAYIKLFEIAMIDGGQILERYKEAVAKIFFIPSEKDEAYKEKSLEYLEKAKKMLKVEHDYLEGLFQEGNLDSVLIDPSTKCSNPKSMGYWYSDADTNRIGDRLRNYGVDTNTNFKGRLTLDVIGSLPLDLEEDKPIYICFNIGGSTDSDGGIHWVAIVLVYHNERVIILYKDPKGDYEKNSSIIHKKFIEHYGNQLEFIHHESVEQQDDYSCGPITMNNLEIMAKKIKETSVSDLVNEFINVAFSDQSQVEKLRKEQNPENSPTEDQGITNFFLKHLQARHCCIGVYLSNIESMIDHINEKNGEDVYFDIGTKASRYLCNLDPNNLEQKQLREIITEKDVKELDDIGMGAIYGLKEIHAVSQFAIDSAQLQLGAGIALLVAAFAFPPLLAVNGPIASIFIAEGITDIILELIKQGEQEFSEKDYIRSKVISYSISLITMGLSALMTSTRVLTKAMNVCRKLSSKLRNSTRFKGVCVSVANKLDKIAKYLECTIAKIKFNRLSAIGQAEYLVALQGRGLQNFEKLKEFQSLSKILKAQDIFRSHNAEIRKVFTDAIVKSVKGVAKSVCMEKIFTATLYKAMGGLKLQIEKWVAYEVDLVVKGQKAFLDSINDEELYKQLRLLFKETSLTEDIGQVLKEISLGVLRHSSNWKMQLVSLGVDTGVTSYEISTYTKKICNKLFENLSRSPRDHASSKRCYDFLIENMSEQISGVVYGMLVAITGKIVTTLPKALFRGYKKCQEKKADRKAVAQHDKRLKDIEAADDGARNRGTTCAHDAVADMLENDSKGIALASSLGPLQDGRGADIGDVRDLMGQSGIESVECSADDAVANLAIHKSDRAVACLKKVGHEGKIEGHVVPCVLENGEMMVVEGGKNIPLRNYQINHGYQEDMRIVVPKDVRADNMNTIRQGINRHRIAKATHPLDYVQGGSYGTKQGKQNNDNNSKPTKPPAMNDEERAIKAQYENYMNCQNSPVSFQVADPSNAFPTPDVTETDIDQLKTRLRGMRNSNHVLNAESSSGKYLHSHTLDNFHIDVVPVRGLNDHFQIEVQGGTGKNKNKNGTVAQVNYSVVDLPDKSAKQIYNLLIFCVDNLRSYKKKTIVATWKEYVKPTVVSNGKRK